MLLELKREGTNDETGAIYGALYLDGEFYGYTLENSSTAILPGSYEVGTRFSPKFMRNKLEIIVPGRNYLMFHGGNTPEDSSGCVLLARQRIDDSSIYGDLSDALYSELAQAARAGEVTLDIIEPGTDGARGLWPFVALAAGAALLYIIK